MMHCSPRICQTEAVTKTLVFVAVVCQCPCGAHCHLISHKARVDICKDDLLNLLLYVHEHLLHGRQGGGDNGLHSDMDCLHGGIGKVDLVLGLRGDKVTMDIGHCNRQVVHDLVVLFKLYHCVSESRV